MPISYSWRILPEQNSEVMEVVAKDAHVSIDVARRQLIEMAAILMEDGANQLGRFETPASVVVDRECPRSLKMVVSYPNKGKDNLVARMVDRRRVLLQAAG